MEAVLQQVVEAAPRSTAAAEAPARSAEWATVKDTRRPSAFSKSSRRGKSGTVGSHKLHHQPSSRES